MSGWSSKRDMLGDEPASLAVGTEVSAKYKGAFCEAKIRKVVRAVKCKVLFKNGLGSATVIDEHVKGVIRNGAVVEAKHPEKKEYIEATITKIQDCSQYTVVFDDGDITTLRRTALCLKSGRHFAESETLDQLPLTHPEHFGTPVIGGRRRRNRTGLDGSSDDEDSLARAAELVIQKEEDIGKVVCVEGSEKRKKDNWFPGLVVAPTAQDTVEIHVKDEYLVRSFKDGRYYTVPKNEATEFTKEVGEKVIANTPKNDTQMLQAVEKAIVFLEKGELPPHWDKELLLYGSNDTGSDSDHGDSESSDDEPREKKDHFVAQLYKFMDDSGTPINKGPTIGGKDVDLYRLFKVVQNLGGYNRVTNNNNWKTISHKMSFGHNPMTISLVKQSYKKFLYSFEEFYRKLGCTMINHPRLSRNRSRSGRSLIRDIDRATPVKVEDKNKPGPSTAPLIVNIKPDPDAPPTPEPPQELPKTYPTLKDKILQKKTHIAPTPIVAAPLPPPPPPPLPMELPMPIAKIKEEKKETEEKLEVKETKKETKPRQTKAKMETEASPTKPETPKETSKDKKNKILLRLAGGNKKENVKSLKPPLVQPKPIGLANTRQKRVMKEKTKALVDQIKGKPIKQFTPTTSSAETEKVPIKVKAVKEEPGINPVGRPKKEDAAPVPSTEEKKKGRKRKEKDAIEENIDAASPNKAVSVGDKLRVFYGPTLESKVTYEAKVLNVREEGTEKLYLVHYNGWNSRYDEWINIARIAHNYSWTGARTPKKFAQMPTPSTKAAKRKVKSDSTANKDPPSTGAPKDPPNTRQGSVGRSTTPSSVSSLPGRKYTNTRACTRSTNKREMSASETDHEYESDSADVEASSKQTDSDSKGPPPSAEKRRKKKKTDVASGASKIKQEPKDEDTSSVIKTRRRRKSSMEKAFEKSKDADKVTVKVEEKTSDDENVELFDSPSAKTKRNSTDNFTDEIKSFENIIPKAEPKDTEEEKPISLFPVAGPNSEKVKIQKEKTTYEEIPSMLKGRDFDLTQIRSELKGIVKGCDTTVPASPGASTESGIEVLKTSDEKDAEDVYEFKEPEPFEFEVRKSIEDKNKMSRRNISGRLFEDKASSKSSSSSPARSKSPILSPSQSPKKDDSGAENQSTIQTCEEAFDKICASPLRAATEQRSHIHLPIFGASEDNSEDDFDDDSQDRLIISERDSDNFSNLSNEKDSEQNVKDVNTAQSDLLVLVSKENFPKDDEDEDLDVDDAINVAIQRAIQESSDDTNDGEFMSKSLSKSNHPTDFSPEQGAKCEAPSAAHLESIGMSTEVEHIKTFPPQAEEPSTTLEVLEEKKDEVDQDDVESHEEITPFNDDEIIVEEDAEELEVEDDEDMLVVAEEQTIEEAPELLIEERDTLQSVPPPDTNILTANEDEDESEENNLDSLICEETIPSSPTPQINSGEEDRGSGTIESHEKKIKEGPLIREPLPPGKEIRQKTEPSLKTADISTVSSPRKQVTSPSTSQGGFSKPGTSVTPKSGAQETLTPNNKPTSESKGKKSDSKNSGKKGRRPRKRSEETSKKRSSRSSRPHLVGSDSDDVVEMGGTSSHRERRSSPRPHKYNFTPVFGPEASFTQKISTLLQSLTNIRKTYVDVKAELAMIDRRRKKLRRRERENAAAAAAASASILASASATAKVH